MRVAVAIYKGSDQLLGVWKSRNDLREWLEDSRFEEDDVQVWTTKVWGQE